MNYRRLGRSGPIVSSFGLGGVVFGREIDEEASFRVLDYALERGITLWDTADSYGYGASETVIGHWLHRRRARDRIVLATKVGSPTSDDADDRGLAPARIAAHIDASLRRLGTDHVDLYQFHSFDPTVPVDESLAAMDRIVRAGKALHIGCSNWAAWQVCRALWLSDRNGWPMLQSVQPPYNLVQTDAERELLPFCEHAGVGVVTYSPLGAGFLTGKYSQGGAIPKGTRYDVMPAHQRVYFGERNWRILETLRARSAELGQPLARLAMAFALTEPRITTVLVGAREPAQIDQAFEAEALGLDPALRQEMHSWTEPR